MAPFSKAVADEKLDRVRKDIAAARELRNFVYARQYDSPHDAQDKRTHTAIMRHLDRLERAHTSKLLDALDEGGEP